MSQEMIEKAVAHYRDLLISQVERAERMNSIPAPEKKEKTVIGVIGGDGIGPIITAQAQRALEALLKNEIAAGTIQIRSISGLTLVCNPIDYLTKVMPATTVLNANGAYVNNLFPIPTDAVQSEFLDANEAILFLAGEYDLLVGGNRGIEYSDEYQFLEDNRVFKVVQYANGEPRWNTTAIVLDLSNLDPAYLNVKVAGTVKTKEQA